MSYVDVKPGSVDEHNMTINNALSRADQLLDDLDVVMRQADNASINSGSAGWKEIMIRWNTLYQKVQLDLQRAGISSEGAIEAIRQGDRGAAAAFQ